ncbi:hypothetical protein ACS0TY_024883 [Phlomoides rotata]
MDDFLEERLVFFKEIEWILGSLVEQGCCRVRDPLVLSLAGLSNHVYPSIYIPPDQGAFGTASSCNGSEDQGTMLATVNPSLFNNKAACGTFYKVRCTGSTSTPRACRNGEVRVKIVVLCPGCGPNQFDLSREAFSVIANPDAGRILIDYNSSKMVFVVNLF